MDWRGLGLAVSKGMAGAAGDQATADRAQADIDEGKLAKENKMRMQIAPLTLALQGYQARFNDAADPNDPSKPAQGKEAEYAAAHDGMAAVIGKIRSIVSPPPKEDAHGLSHLAHIATDKLHITRHAVENARQAQAKKVQQYNQQTADTVKNVEAGNIPFAMTTEGRKEAAALALQQEKNKGAAARGSSTRPVPYYAGAVNKAQATDLAKAGKVFKDADGNEIDVSQIPEGMFLLPVFAGGGKEYYELGTDKGRYETGDNRRKFEPSVGGPNPNAPDIGAARVPVEHTSTTVDPFGVQTTTTSRTTPQGASSTTAPPVQGPKTRQLHEVRGRTSQGSAQPQLDENGHIPASAGNPNLVQAANELLDGKSQKDLQVPQKDKQAAAALAAKYGYLGEGMWTPRERMQVDQSQALLDKLRGDKTFLAVYNQGPIKRALIQTAIDKSKDHGFRANMTRTLLNMGLDEKDVHFVQSYQNLIGRIQGLALLTRGSGRPTEAAVNRMMQELPNVLTARTAEEAQHAFDLIQNEIDIGMGKRKGGPKTQQLNETKQNVKQNGVIVVSPEDMNN